MSEKFQQFVKIFRFLFRIFKLTDHFLVLLSNIPNFKIWIQCWFWFGNKNFDWLVLFGLVKTLQGRHGEF